MKGRQYTKIAKYIQVGVIGSFLLFVSFFMPPSFAQRCSAVPYDSLLQKRYPYWALKRRLLEDSVQNTLHNPSRKNLRTAVLCETIRIPVVVHVIHNNAAGTTGGRDNVNISDEQILSQIKILNEDYRRKAGTRGFNNNPVGADTGIEFYLANVDPNNQPTNGITRHYYPNKTSFDIFSDDQLLANIVSWPTDLYMNIWVTRFSGSFLGVAQFPSVTGVQGLDNSSELQERTDGVFIDFRVFGVGSAVTSRLYNLGRTTTHEVGHWLGLIHTWGDTNCGDDYCADTPTAESGNQSANCGPVFSNCSGQRMRNMTENYLDYSPDSCMNIFTKNQAERMLAVIEKAPRRARLVKYWCASVPFGEKLAVRVYPNPAPSTERVKVEVTLKEFGDFEVEVYSVTGQLVKRFVYEDYPSWIVDFPTDDMAAGSYIVRVKTKDETFTSRLIIRR
ncbi:M43 family zinc metalloprotease [Runella zeae]|uniref:M43 family zinc metalloprotease n=1 Tax=Runella zeae TaxID=94255 RepID=UPI0004097011|nr:M43 family zinc metalloprotease [Runella zeae]